MQTSPSNSWLALTPPPCLASHPQTVPITNPQQVLPVAGGGGEPLGQIVSLETHASYLVLPSPQCLNSDLSF